MKKLFLFTIILSSLASFVFAAEFSPTLLKLSVDPIIQYDFDGSSLSIPVHVSGTNAGVIFLVYTKGKANEIGFVKNGYLGWHSVNKVDTCIYFSTLQSLGVGQQTITWNGKDQDGGVVPPGEYTYYMWAFDNVGSKTIMTKQLNAGGKGGVRGSMFYGIDENGLPLSNPFILDSASGTTKKKWIIGSDPFDPALFETTKLTVAQGWDLAGSTSFILDPTDRNYFFQNVANSDAHTAGIMRWKWVPGGDAESDVNFGDAGLSDLYYIIKSYAFPGVETDGTYLFASENNLTTSTEPDADFFIYDLDGFLVDQIDISKWWSNPNDFAAGGEMNGGPRRFGKQASSSQICLNGWTCLVQWVDPARFLETGETDDFLVWENRNGDYTLDKNFEETSQHPWVCNYNRTGPWLEGVNPDGHGFCAGNAYDLGAVSFGLIAPDGTGVGYLAYAGETAGWKQGQVFISDGTPFDGIYTDDNQSAGSLAEWDSSVEQAKGIYFVGHHSIKGTITSAVAVDESAPLQFTLEQNSPNPFNPATTIKFSLANSADVTVDVFNVAGQKVDTLVNDFMHAGSHEVLWNAAEFSSGVYFYTLKTNDFSKTLRMTLIK